MLIQSFCRRANVSKDTVRHYESLGLLKPQRVNAGTRHYRHYDDTHLERIELIRIGAQAGMTLRSMKPLLDQLMAGEFSFAEQRRIVHTQLAEIDAKIVALQTARVQLEHQFARIDARETAALHQPHISGQK
ncbi:MAG: MerR family transcriptional regulator [Pseudomonadota bacterium]